jgi:hypothetical protein
VGFGLAFECKVASEIAEFVPRHGDADCRSLRGDSDTVVGSIVIDWGHDAVCARLR